MKSLLLVLLLPVTCFARGGDGSGGGSLIESAFRLRATALINKIATNSVANAFCPAPSLTYGLSHSDVNAVPELKDPVTHAVIENEDAWTAGGEIQLLRSVWAHLTDQDRGPGLTRSYDALILHELYRSTSGACIDDHFVITDQVFPIIDGTAPPPTPTKPPFPAVTITGASTWNTSLGQISIFGGLAGAAGLPGTGLLNNCSGPSRTPICLNTQGVDQFPLCSCNPQRIADSTLITIQVHQNVPLRGRVHIVGPQAATNSVIPPVNGIGADLIGSNSQMGQVTLPWSSICLAMGEPTGSCEGVGEKTISLALWVDNNPTISGGTQFLNSPNVDDVTWVTFNTIVPDADESVYSSELAAEGVGQFTPAAGDGRIYLTNVNTAAVFPLLSGDGSTATAMMIFVSTQGMDKANPADADATAAIPISGTDFINQYIDVAKGHDYFVRLALVDQAGNILQFYPSTRETPAACSGPHADVSHCPFAVHVNP